MKEIYKGWTIYVCKQSQLYINREKNLLTSPFLAFGKKYENKILKYINAEGNSLTEALIKIKLKIDSRI